MARIPKPTTYTPKVAAEILRRIAHGEPLNRICGPKRRKGLPERMTVYNWLKRHEEFRRAYIMARLAQVELLTEDVLLIADGKDEDSDEPRTLPRDRLRVETRRWLAAVMLPKIYGDPAALVSIAEDEPSIEEEDHIAARIAAILEAARRRTIGDAD